MLGYCLLGRLVAGEGLVSGLRPLGDPVVEAGAACERVGEEDLEEPMSKFFLDNLSLMLPNTDRLEDMVVWV